MVRINEFQANLGLRETGRFYVWVLLTFTGNALFLLGLSRIGLYMPVTFPC